jgi:hypothetical protein
MSDQMPPAMRSGPDCGNPPEGCRLVTGSKIQEPLIPWSPEYNGMGQIVNADPNTFIKTQKCSVCGGEWEDTITMAADGSHSQTRVVTPPQTLTAQSQPRPQPQTKR